MHREPKFFMGHQSDEFFKTGIAGDRLYWQFGDEMIARWLSDDILVLWLRRLPEKAKHRNLEYVLEQDARHMSRDAHLFFMEPCEPTPTLEELQFIINTQGI